jgi:excisionase family DNA binding protein
MGHGDRESRELVTVSEAMRQLACSKTLIYTLASRKQLELVKLGRATRISQRSIDRFLKR